MVVESGCLWWEEGPRTFCFDILLVPLGSIFNVGPSQPQGSLFDRLMPGEVGSIGSRVESANRGTERLGNLHKATQLLSDRA